MKNRTISIVVAACLVMPGMAASDDEDEPIVLSEDILSVEGVAVNNNLMILFDDSGSFSSKIFSTKRDKWVQEALTKTLRDKSNLNVLVAGINGTGLATYKDFKGSDKKGAPSAELKRMVKTIRGSNGASPQVTLHTHAFRYLYECATLNPNLPAGHPQRFPKIFFSKRWSRQKGTECFIAPAGLERSCQKNHII